MGFSSTGQIIATGWNASPQQVIGPILPAKTWTNVISTYSITNGVRLYVNGTLISSTGGMIYLASGLVNILTLANPRQGIEVSAGAGEVHAIHNQLFRMFILDLVMNFVFIQEN